MIAKTSTKQVNTGAIASSLNSLLADEHILYVKTRRAHWNVEGADFLTIHRFFEDQYKQLEELIDEIAERVRTIGHYAEATLARFLELTHLSEETREDNDSKGFIRLLLIDHEAIIFHLRENIYSYSMEWGDPGSVDFITGTLKTHEKMAWMLRSHLL